MKQGWTYKKLGEVASYINGYAFKPEQWKEEGTPIVRIQNLNNPDAPYNYYDGEVPDKIKIQDGDLLISWSASLGAYIWNGGNAFLNQHIFKVVFNKTDIDKMFLKYAVTSKLETMSGQVHGATMKHIVKKDFDNTLIPYPPKSQQLAIVSELDKINELIRLKKEQLSDYDKLAQSLFYEMFGDPVENEKGWEVKTLGEVCDITSSKRIFADEYVESGIPFYRSKEVIEKSKGEPISVELYISKDRYNEVKDSYGVPAIGDILITAVGTIGKIWVVDSKDSFYFKDGNLVWLRNIKNTESTFFKISLFYLIDEYKKTNANGAAYNALTIAKLKQMICPLPPLTLQQLFAERIEHIEKQKAQITSTIRNLETLLASRMQFWFDINEAADAIVNNYYAEKMIEDKYDELYLEGNKSLSINYGECIPRVVNQLDFKALASAYNYILDNGANTFENIDKALYLSIDKAHFCALVELGFIGTEDYKTFNIPQ